MGDVLHVDEYGYYKLDTLLLLLTADLRSSLMNAMLMANVQAVMPSTKDISSAIGVRLYPATDKNGYYNLRLTITPLDIKVKPRKSGVKRNTKKE